MKVTRMAVALVGPFRASLRRVVLHHAGPGLDHHARPGDISAFHKIRSPVSHRLSLDASERFKPLRQQGMYIATETILENHESYIYVAAWIPHAVCVESWILDPPSLSLPTESGTYIIPHSFPLSLILGDM